MNTQLYKGGNGWKAETKVSMSTDRVLLISTYKSMRGDLVTHASVYSSEGTSLVVHMPFSDFSRRLSHEDARCTERNVREAHQDALARIDSVLADAIAHYAATGEGVAHG